MVIAAALVFVSPLPGFAANNGNHRNDPNGYGCPLSFASQSLGIQNVVLKESQRSVVTEQPGATAKRASAVANANAKPSPILFSGAKPPRVPGQAGGERAPLCPVEAAENGGNDEAYTIRGLVYLPSNNNKNGNSNNNNADTNSLPPGGQTKNESRGRPNAQNSSSNNRGNNNNYYYYDDDASSLILTVSSSENPSSSIALMGARIPTRQIRSFPVSFALSRSSGNFLMVDESWEESILGATNDLYVTATICSPGPDEAAMPRSANGCGIGDHVVFQGRGTSRKLLVPNNRFGADEDDFRTVRGAASIRMSRASTPDTLFTW